MTHGVPPGWRTVTPRVVVEDAAAFVAFLKRVFGATGELHTGAPSQIRIGDSLLMVSPAETQTPRSSGHLMRAQCRWRLCGTRPMEISVGW